MRTTTTNRRRYTDREIAHGIYAVTLPTGETVEVPHAVMFAMRRHAYASGTALVRIRRIGVRIGKSTACDENGTWENRVHVADYRIPGPCKFDGLNFNVDYRGATRTLAEIRRIIADNLTLVGIA